MRVLDFSTQAAQNLPRVAQLPARYHLRCVSWSVARCWLYLAPMAENMTVARTASLWYFHTLMCRSLANLQMWNFTVLGAFRPPHYHREEEKSKDLPSGASV